MSERQVPRGGVAPPLVFLECLGRDDLDVAAVKRVDRAQPRRFLLLDHPRDLVHRQLIELIRQPVRQELEENDAQRVYIRPSVEPGRVGGDLFGTHVAQGAQQLTGLGSARGRQSRSAAVTWATPKSSTLGWPDSSTRMLPGLRSRWMTPLSWACCTASHTAATSSSARPRRDSTSARTRPAASRG